MLLIIKQQKSAKFCMNQVSGNYRIFAVVAVVRVAAAAVVARLLLSLLIMDELALVMALFALVNAFLAWCQCCRWWGCWCCCCWLLFILRASILFHVLACPQEQEGISAALVHFQKSHGRSTSRRRLLVGQFGASSGGIPGLCCV